MPLYPWYNSLVSVSNEEQTWSVIGSPNCLAQRYCTAVVHDKLSACLFVQSGRNTEHWAIFPMVICTICMCTDAFHNVLNYLGTWSARQMVWFIQPNTQHAGAGGMLYCVTVLCTHYCVL